MGPVSNAPVNLIYFDANAFIYSVERVAPYDALLRNYWQLTTQGQAKIVTSELTVLEVLVRPLRLQDHHLVSLFRSTLTVSPDVRLLPISLHLLEQAAQIRATSGLKTPDAIHAATALLAGVTSFVTSDAAFQRLAALPVQLLRATP